VEHPRDIYRLEQQLRSLAASRTGPGGPSGEGSTIVRDWRREDIGRRKSA